MAPRRSILSRRLLLAEACLWLLVARAALLLVPFPRLARGWGAFVAQPDGGGRAGRTELSAQDAAKAAAIGWAVARAARRAPFKLVCLPKAMAARWMLRCRSIPSVLHFGAAHVSQPIEAHAWLDAGGVKVAGYPLANNLIEIGRFT
jgi:hypothetical protein